jgi:mono/diheme cytochrome c family protein
MRSIRLLVGVALVGVVSVAGLSAQPKGQPVFTKEQADAGRKQYADTCARCHADDLGGNAEAPALAGGPFMNSWGTQTTQDLFKYAQGMPPDGSRLQTAEYLNVVAFILNQNGAVPGAQALAADTAVRVDTIATGEKPAAGGRD